MSHITDNHDALLDYLYEEGDAAGRLATAKHLQECAACAVAVLEFQNVRGMLRDWTAPASASVRPSVNQGPTTYQEQLTGQHMLASPRFRTFLQAAAAILLFVSGMAVSQFVPYGRDVVTEGTRRDAPLNGRAASGGASSAGAPPAALAAADIDEIARRVRAQLAQDNAASADGERLLQQVRAMIGQSEQRQQRELALRLSQVAGEVDAQHRVDVERIQQDFGKQQEATMEYLVRTSGGVK